MLSIIVVLITIVFLLFYRKRRTETFDYKCFLLTLPKEEKRRERFMKHHNKDIPIEIIYGSDTRDVKKARKFENQIDGDYFEKAIEMHYNDHVKRPDITYFNLGAIGCFMGHLEFYDRCFKQGLKYAVIFEDNVIIKSDRLYKEIQNVINDRGDEFEMCFFHCLSRLTDKQDGKLEKVKWISSTKCYLINVENMKNYVKYFLPMDNHIDMKHEDLINKGARIYYKDMRRYIKIDRTHNSTIGHYEHGRPDFFSRNHPSATPNDVKWGY
jgi:GR25 family glycosyltransferase involved in LPS biosynthesis